MSSSDSSRQHFSTAGVIGVSVAGGVIGIAAIGMVAYYFYGKATAAPTYEATAKAPTAEPEEVSTDVVIVQDVEMASI